MIFERPAEGCDLGPRGCFVYLGLDVVGVFRTSTGVAAIKGETTGCDDKKCGAERLLGNGRHGAGIRRFAGRTATSCLVSSIGCCGLGITADGS